VYATLDDSPALAAARLLAAADMTTTVGDVRFPALEDQVCAEAGLWAPDVARRALAQAGGDPPRAVALVRVWAAALPQLRALPIDDADIQLTRRISAAYAQVPEGQWLGASPELASRLLDWRDDGVPASEPPPDPASTGSGAGSGAGNGDGGPARAPTRADCPRVRDLLDDVPVLAVEADDADGADPAARSVRGPLDRPTRLGVMARGETGALVALAALVLGRRREAVLAEVTAGVAGVRIDHPRTGVACTVAEVPITDADAVVDAEVDGRPGFAIGWGASLGALERRVVALALLDGALQADQAPIPSSTSTQPSAAGDHRLDAATHVLDDHTVLAVVDGSATTGFVEHLRLPHHASFASALDQVRDG
jgi:alpha-D-ribose 1-methylphosphonate 5-triphosphate synthase subunit PhnI